MARKPSAKGPSQRQLRLGEMLRHTLAEVLTREEIRDDDLRGRIITVSEVRIDPAAKSATAYVLPLGGDQQDVVVDALNRHAKFLRGEVSRRVHLKFTPQFRFELDTSFDEASRIDAALRQPNVSRDLGPEDAASDAEIDTAVAISQDDEAGR